MIAVDLDLLRKLVAQARLAPSVHNIQPTRFSLEDGAILLHGADPTQTSPSRKKLIFQQVYSGARQV